jgi:hypothetical protein
MTYYNAFPTKVKPPVARDPSLDDLLEYVNAGAAPSAGATPSSPSLTPAEAASLGAIFRSAEARLLHEQLADEPTERLLERVARAPLYAATGEIQLARERLNRLMPNFVLTHRRVPPSLRGERPHPPIDFRTAPNYDVLHFADSVVRDVDWAFSEHRPLSVRMPGYPEFDDLMAGEVLDLDLTAEFGKRSKSHEHKATVLGLNRHQQLELASLRPDDVDRRFRALLELRSTEVAMHLRNAFLNPKRAKKADEASSVPFWSNVWWAWALADGIEAAAVRFYDLISRVEPGPESPNGRRLQKLRNTIQKALRERGQPALAREMFRPGSRIRTRNDP